MADNIVCHCSLLGCLFGWRAGSIGELTHVNGQQMWTERLMFRRFERQVESNDCLFIFLDVSRETLTFCPPNIEKKFPLKGGFVRQKHLGKMITIDFFDDNERFVVRHILEFEKDCYYEVGDAVNYIESIFSYYQSAGSAKVTIRGVSYRVDRYE